MSAVFSKYSPHVVIAESPFFQKNAKTITRLGHCHGILLLLAVEYGKRMKYYSPLTIKSTVLGGIKTKNEDGKKKTGKEMKKEVEEAVFKIFPQKDFKLPYTDDVTDAISVALAYIYKKGEGTMGEKKEDTKKNKKK
jgi:Holliday junction resolvasome RuvABC endonuclease subunit